MAAAEESFMPGKLGLSRCGEGTTEKAVSGDKIQLTTGQLVQLADVKAPEYWLSSSLYNSWPHADTSRSKLNDLLRGKQVKLYCYKSAENFQGIKEAHVILGGDHWLQAWLLEEGLAFAYPVAKSRPGIRRLYQWEEKARSRQIGIWAQSAYAPRQAVGSELEAGWFRIVRGQVVQAQKVKNKIYLNFEENWRRDFTIEIPASIARKLEQAGIDPLLLSGRYLEVRGIIEWGGGPKITLTSAGRLTVIPEE